MNDKPIVESGDEKAVVEYVAKDGQKIKLSPQIIKKFLVSGKSEFVTMQELYYFMGVSKSRGLNPFINDCYLIKYSPNDSAAIVVSIDYYRKRARAQSDCRGWKAGIVLLKGEELIYREGCILLDGEVLVGGWFEAQPAEWDVPMRKEVNLNRYIKRRKDGNPTQFWSPDNQPEQIAKVAESQGLRAAWPDEFQSLYTDAEMESRDAQAELGEAVSKADEKDIEKDLQKTLGESSKSVEGVDEAVEKDLDHFKDEPVEKKEEKKPKKETKKKSSKKSEGKKKAPAKPKKSEGDGKQESKKVANSGNEAGSGEDLEGDQGETQEISFDDLVQTDEWNELLMLKEQHPKFYLKTLKGQTPRTLEAVSGAIEKINQMITDEGGDGIPTG